MKDAKQLYHGYRFPPTIISHAVLLYPRFCLRLRDVEDLLAERGIAVSYESFGNGAIDSGRNKRKSLRNGKV